MSAASVGVAPSGDAHGAKANLVHVGGCNLVTWWSGSDGIQARSLTTN